MMRIAVLAFGFVSTGWANPCPTQPPLKVIPLAPALVEMVVELKKKETKIIGVTEYSPIIEGAQSIGPFHKVSIEKIHSLKPDLIFATQDGNSPEDVKKLKALGYKVEVVQSENTKQIKESFAQVACALSNPESSDKWVKELERTLEGFKIKYEKAPRTQVIYQLGFNPFVSMSSETYLSELLAVFGLENKVKNLKKSLKYPRLSKEWVYSSKPDFVLILAMIEDHESKESLKFWSSHKIKAKWILNSEIMRPGPKLIEGLKKFEKTWSQK